MFISNHDNQVIHILNDIFDNAIKKNASDIHIEQSQDYLKVRLRIDGMLQEYKKFDKNIANQIISRLKILASLDIAEKRLPQDGSIKLNHLIEFRISTCPTIHGEKVVLRLLKIAANALKLSDLGMESWQETLLLQTIKKSQGLILITGPTGSGKTSSLYATLNELNTAMLNIMTVEDPVEITLPSVNQVNINPKIGVSFANLLRTLLRQDPNVIMIGEIRDQETADIAIKAAQTGHLILSTLHTNSATETITRLKLLGVTNYEFLNTINLIINQRLLRKLCEVCKTEDHNATKILKKYDFLHPSSTITTHHDTHPTISKSNSSTIFKPNGCSLCNNGYRGRIGAFEFLPKHHLQKILIGRKNSAKSSLRKKTVQNSSHNSYALQHTYTLQNSFAHSLLRSFSNECKKTKIVTNNKNHYSLKQTILNKILIGVTSLEELRRVL